MRFICPEIINNTNELYRKDPLDQDVIIQNDYFLYKSNKLFTKETGTKYSYLNDTLRNVIFSQFVYDGTSRTPAAWITAKGLTGTDHTGFSGTFDFQNNTVMDIRCSYFFTIVAEDGLHFAKPERISTSKELINFIVLSELKNYETDFNYQGETGKKFTVAESNDNVRAITIDSTLKSARVNKYKSLQNVLTVQSGVDLKPLDYFQNSGKYYIVISKQEVKSDLFVYTGVLESKDTVSIAGSNISNVALSTINTLANKLVYSATLGANAASWTISGLDLVSDGGTYVIWADLKLASSGDYLYFYINGDTTEANYTRHVNQWDNTASNGNRADTAEVGYIDDASFYVLHFTLMTSAGSAAYGVYGESNWYDRHTYPTQVWWSHKSGNVTNATSISLLIGGGLELISGCRIKIWRR